MDVKRQQSDPLPCELQLHSFQHDSKRSAAINVQHASQHQYLTPLLGLHKHAGNTHPSWSHCGSPGEPERPGCSGFSAQLNNSVELPQTVVFRGDALRWSSLLPSLGDNSYATKTHIHTHTQMNVPHFKFMMHCAVS